jgi:hypothetical protein
VDDPGSVKFEDGVVDRLFALNERRAEAERAQGATGRTKPGMPTKGVRAKKRDPAPQRRVGKTRKRT